MNGTWVVSVFGKQGDRSWEISVVRADNAHGQKSYGWFDDSKLLVGHDGGPCHVPICDFVWNRHMETANALCAHLNAGGAA